MVTGALRVQHCGHSKIVSRLKRNLESSEGFAEKIQCQIGLPEDSFLWHAPVVIADFETDKMIWVNEASRVIHGPCRIVHVERFEPHVLAWHRRSCPHLGDDKIAGSCVRWAGVVRENAQAAFNIGIWIEGDVSGHFLPDNLQLRHNERGGLVTEGSVVEMTAKQGLRVVYDESRRHPIVFWQDFQKIVIVGWH